MFELKDSPAPPAASPTRAGAPVDPGRLWSTLARARRGLLIAAAVGLVVGAGLAKTAIPREFTSAATIVWEPGAPFAGEPRQDARELRSMVDSMMVPGALAEVRRRLALPVPIYALGRRVAVTSTDKSNQIIVSATWGDADTPPRVANAIVDVFLERRVEVQRSRLEAWLKAASNDATKAAGELQEARKAYDAFREENGVVDLAAETQVAIEQAAKLYADAGVAKADAAGEEARSASLQKAASRQPTTAVLSSTELHPQALKRAEIEAELAGARESLSPEHPKVLALEAKIEGLQRGMSSGSVVPGDRVIGRNPQLDAIQQIWAGSAAAREASTRREGALLEQAKAASARVTRLRSLEGKANELSGAVHRAQERLDEIEKLRTKAAVAIRNPEPGFRVVDTAARPDAPSKSNRRLFAAAAPFGALAIAAFYLIGRALWGLYVHTARELAFWGGGPVIASSRYPDDPRARRDLIVDLWAHGEATRGVTLVVPMSIVERGDAELVASALNPPDVGSGALSGESSSATLWTGATSGPELRRAARLADRVLVVVKAGAHTAASVAAVPDRIGRAPGVGYILLGVGGALSALPDRAGDVRGFWGAGGEEALLGLRAGSREVSNG